MPPVGLAYQRYQKPQDQQGNADHEQGTKKHAKSSKSTKTVHYIVPHHNLSLPLSLCRYHQGTKERTGNKQEEKARTLAPD